MSSLLPLANRLDQLQQMLRQLEQARPHQPLPIPHELRYRDGQKLVERCRRRTTVSLRLPGRLRKEVRKVDRSNRHVVELSKATRDAAREW